MNANGRYLFLEKNRKIKEKGKRIVGALVGLAATVPLALGLYFGLRREKQPESIEQPAIYEPFESPDKFSDKNILVYCDKGERISFLENLNFQNQNYGRAEELKAFIRNDNGKTKYDLTNLEKGEKIIVPNFNNGKLEESVIEVIDMGKEKIPEKKYDIVQIRGHGERMEELYGKVKNNLEENSLVVLGGCLTFNFVCFVDPKNNNAIIPMENRPVIFTTDRRGTETNNTVLLAIIDSLRKTQGSNWKAVRADILNSAPKSLREELEKLVIPGDVDYDPNNMENICEREYANWKD